MRWSSDDQTQGDSAERQGENIRAYCAAKGWRLALMLDDSSVSARDGANLRVSNLATFQREAIAGRWPPGVLVFDEPSRLSRGDEYETMEFVAPLVNRGFSLAFVRADVVLAKRDKAGLMKYFQFATEQSGGHQQNETRIGQVRSECERRRKSLRPLDMETGAPGVVYSARVPLWLVCPKVTGKRQHQRQITLHPERAPVGVQIFEWTADKIGSIRIAQRLNQLAETDPRYKPWGGATRWTANFIQKLTTNRAVLGEFQPHRVEPKPGAVANPNTKHKRKPFLRIADGPAVAGYYPPLITQDLWHRTQEAKAVNQRAPAGRPNRTMVNILAACVGAAFAVARCTCLGGGAKAAATISIAMRRRMVAASTGRITVSTASSAPYSAVGRPASKCCGTIPTSRKPAPAPTPWLPGWTRRSVPWSRPSRASSTSASSCPWRQRTMTGWR
jgi:hypothetical protein